MSFTMYCQIFSFSLSFLKQRDYWALLRSRQNAERRRTPPERDLHARMRPLARYQGSQAEHEVFVEGCCWRPACAPASWCALNCPNLPQPLGPLLGRLALSRLACAMHVCITLSGGCDAPPKRHPLAVITPKFGVAAHRSTREHGIPAATHGTSRGLCHLPPAAERAGSWAGSDEPQQDVQCSSCSAARLPRTPRNMLQRRRAVRAHACWFMCVYGGAVMAPPSAGAEGDAAGGRADVCGGGGVRGRAPEEGAGGAGGQPGGPRARPPPRAARRRRRGRARAGARCARFAEHCSHCLHVQEVPLWRSDSA